MSAELLDIPSATLANDIRRNATTTEPILLLIGSPMGAAGFGTLAGHFAERTVVMYDPRGADRSQKTDPASPSMPEDHAHDLHRLIQALDAGPVDSAAAGEHIYGGGGAIGSAGARAFAAEGARVYLAGRTLEKLEMAAEDFARPVKPPCARCS